MDEDRPISVCEHLESNCDYTTWFTGREKDCYWVCEPCAKKFPELPEPLLEVSAELLEGLRRESFCEGVKGKPEIKKRESRLKFEHQDVELEFPGGLIDIQPNLKTADGWFALLASGDFAMINAGTLTVLYRLTDLGFPLDLETQVCISPNHDLAAVFETSKNNACVFDLQTGAIVKCITRGNYRCENTHFPISFFDDNGESLLVYATDWNHLEVINPKNSQMLTERGPTPTQFDESKSNHALNYFHGQLTVSPEQNWIVDYGWVWAPWGIVKSWNLQEWLHRNPWESEDGSSLRNLKDCRYVWDGPLCWIDDTTIAIWGWGFDEDWLVDAVLMYDVTTGERLRWFAGPETRSTNAYPPKKLAPSLFFDKYLYAVKEKRGTTVWDILTGEQLLHEETLAPIRHHLKSGEFLSLIDSGFRLSRLAEA